MEAFRLGTRIASRVPWEVLQEELGESVAEELREDLTISAGRQLLLLEVAREVAANLTHVGVQVVFLKGIALYLMGVTAPGGREAGDVDVLVPAEGAERAVGALLKNGFRRSSHIEEPTWHHHHLPALIHSSGIPVEIHTSVMGVRTFNGRGWAGAEDWLKACSPAPGMERGSYVPDVGLLAVHLAVHGLVQHVGTSVEQFALRLIGDIQDLCAFARRDDLLIQPLPAGIEGTMGRSERQAVMDMTCRLGRGEDPAVLLEEDGPPGVLFRHLVAGVLDEEYRRCLAVAVPMGMTVSGGFVWRLLRKAKKTVWPNRRQLEARFGPAETWYERVVQRFRRLVQVPGLFVKYGVPWLKVRLAGGLRDSGQDEKAVGMHPEGSEGERQMASGKKGSAAAPGLEGAGSRGGIGPPAGGNALDEPSRDGGVG